MSHGWYTCNICNKHYHESENDGDCSGFSCTNNTEKDKMITTIHKIHTSRTDPHSLFAEVTVDSITNHAILIGHNFTDSRTVVYSDEVDRLIEILTILKETYLK